MAIDAHVHVWTDDFARYPIAAGFTPQEMKPPVFRPEEILSHARASGVERVVLVQMSYYGTDNRYMLDTMCHYPGVFGGIAVIDAHAEDVEAQMDRLGEQGVRGFRLQPGQSAAGSWLDSPGLHRTFGHAAATDQSLCCLMNPDGLPALDRMCEAYPDTSVVIDHLCRIGVDGQVREADVAALRGMARHEQVRVKVSAFYALGRKQPPHDELLPMIRQVVSAFGARRLMWGSDCPYQVQDETYDDGLALLRERFAFDSDEDREWVLGKTAEQTFF